MALHHEEKGVQGHANPPQEKNGKGEEGRGVQEEEVAKEVKGEEIVEFLGVEKEEVEVMG